MRIRSRQKSFWLTEALIAFALAGSLRADSTDAVPAPEVAKPNQAVRAASPAAESTLVPKRNPAPTAPSPLKSSLPGRVGTMSMIWPLLIVAGAIFTFAMMLKKWGPGRRGTIARNGLQVLTRQYLSNKQSLCLIRLGRRVVFLGVTPERISTLAQVDDPEEVASLVGTIERNTPSSFTAKLSGFAARTSGPVDEPATEPPVGKIEIDTSSAGRQLRTLLGRVRVMADSQTSAEPV
jgi:flagellar biogenesis protein FliO